jgi:hypothetical protein
MPRAPGSGCFVTYHALPLAESSPEVLAITNTTILSSPLKKLITSPAPQSGPLKNLINQVPDYNRVPPDEIRSPLIKLRDLIKIGFLILIRGPLIQSRGPD